MGNCTFRDDVDLQDRILLLQRENQALKDKYGVANAQDINLSTAGRNCLTTEDPEVPEFINASLLEMWPYLSRFVSDILKKDLEPALTQAIPNALGVSIEREHTHLGIKPLTFNEMHASKFTQQTRNGAISSLCLRTQIEWNADDISIYLKIAKAGIGINKLTIRGHLIIDLVGMMDTLPLFGGIRAYFINPPFLDLNFQGVTTLLNMGFIKRSVLSAISSAISQALVIPNRQGALFDSSADFFSVLRPRPEGVLKLTIVSAQNLLAMDPSLISQSTSDPYVVLSCGANNYKSPVVSKNLNPMFGWSVYLLIYSYREQRAKISLMDKDVFGTDDFLGNVDVNINDLLCLGPEKKEIELEDENGHVGKNGSITIDADWNPLELDTVLRTADHLGLVFVGVYSAVKVPKKRTETEYWWTVHCSNVAPESVPDDQDAQKDTIKVVPAEDLAASQLEEADEAKKLQEKLSILAKYNVCDEDIAQILELDPKQVAENRGGCKTKETHARLEWNHSFEFLVTSPKLAQVDLKLNCQEPSKSVECLGTYQFSMSSLLDSGKHTDVQVNEIGDAGIKAKIVFQLRQLAAP